MKPFNLYIIQYNYISPDNPILIPIGASHDTISTTPQGTYNEKLTRKPNSQAQLTFNIATIVNNQRNHNADFMVDGQHLRLVFDNDRSTCIDFFITKVLPSVAQNNTILSITAVDWFSYELSHAALGLTYDTLDDKGPLYITDLSQTILNESCVPHWKLNNDLVNARFPRFPDQTKDVNNVVEPMRISFSVSNSNCYNALIEIAKKFDATIVPSYNWSGRGGYIDFVKNNNMYSNIYHVSPSVNINNFGISNQATNLSTIMYVTGGTDAKGNTVGLMPEIPAAFAEWLMSGLLYPDDKKPSCIEHRYPFLYTWTKDSQNDQIIYTKWSNPLYTDNPPSPELNNSGVAGLLTSYAVGEMIEFSIPSQSYVTTTQGGKPTTVEYAPIVKLNGTTYNPQGTTYIELTPHNKYVIEVPSTNEPSIRLLIEYHGDSNAIDVSKTVDCNLNIINAEWKNTKSENLFIWENQRYMVNVYKAFKQDWESDTSFLKQYKDKFLPQRNSMILQQIYQLCDYIDKKLPTAGNFVYDFSYFHEKRLINDTNKYNLEYILNHELRNINLRILLLSKQYYSLNYDILNGSAIIKNYLANYLAELDTHMQNIMSVDETNKTGTPIIRSVDIDNIIQNTTPNIIVPFIESSELQDDIYGDYSYYQELRNNALLNIISNLLTEGLTPSYVRKCLTFYGSSYFNSLFITPSVVDPIYVDKTNEYFDLLNEYNAILGISRGANSFKELTDAESLKPNISNTTQLEADTILARANALKNQASYYYNDQGEIFKDKPQETKEQTASESDDNSKKTVHYYYKPSIGKLYISILQQFLFNTNSAYYPILIGKPAGYNIKTDFENLLKDRDTLWKQMRETYSDYIIESSFTDSTQIDSYSLYNAAIFNFERTCKPNYTYSISTINSSQMSGDNLENIKIGERIQIHHPVLFQKPNYHKTKITVIPNDANKRILKYMLPVTNTAVRYVANTRIALLEKENPTMTTYGIIAGTHYGDKLGTIISTDINSNSFVVEWNKPFGIYDNIYKGYIGRELVLGDYEGILQIQELDEIPRNNRTGKWYYIKDKVGDTDNKSRKPTGLKPVYQFLNDTDSYKTDVFYTDKVASITKTSFSDNPNTSYYQITFQHEPDQNIDIVVTQNDLLVVENKQNHKIYFIQLIQQISDHTWMFVNITPEQTLTLHSDFVYEAEELYLTVTGTTQTLRESVVQLDVQNNDLINSIVDKLIYSVRSN